MCQIVWFATEGHPDEIESLAQFRAAFPGIEIVGDPGPSGDECCLCPVDIEATFTKAGIQFERDQSFMGWEVFAPAPEESAGEKAGEG